MTGRMTLGPGLLFGALCLLAAVLPACQRLDPFLYIPKPLTAYTFETSVIPADHRREVAFNSADGTQLYGVAVSAGGAHSHITVFYCHGNKWNMDYYWPRVGYFYRMGFNVFTFDYRGFGRSAGRPGNDKVLEDAWAAWNVARSEFSGASFAIYGYSLGGAPATDVAVRTADEMALILEATFTSVSGMVTTGSTLDLPVDFLADDRLDTVAKIGSVGAPLLLMHGTADHTVPYRYGERIFAAARDPKWMITLPGAAHDTYPTGELGVPDTLGHDWDGLGHDYDGLVTRMILGRGL